MTGRIVAAALALLVCAGCEDKPPEPTAAPSSATPPAASGTGSTVAANASAKPAFGDKYRDEDVPVPPDFEAKVAKDVTKANYKEKLAELEKQIRGPAAGSAEPSTSAAPSTSATPPPSAAPTAVPAAP